MDRILRVAAFLAVVGSILVASLYQEFSLVVAVVALGVLYLGFYSTVAEYYSKNVLYNKSLDVPNRDLHNERRFKTYPSPVMNTWYHFCDSSQLKNGQVMEYRALGRVYVLWRDNNGKPVCQDAFCLHQGANLGVGGKVVDNCLECPFHKWKFTSNGTIHEVPYLKDPTACQSLNRKQKTYTCMDWCGWLLVYFHADDKDPEFYPPAFVSDQLKTEGWSPHLSWDAGYYNFSPVDIVDQAGDHAHFQTLHSEFMIPWTKIPFPEWFRSLVPLAISHTCATYRGDGKDWAERVQETGWGVVDKYLLFFSDVAGLTWRGKLMPTTVAQTLEVYVGPALVIFNIPFTLGMCWLGITTDARAAIAWALVLSCQWWYYLFLPAPHMYVISIATHTGTIKIFLSMTPIDNGTSLRVRSWMDRRVFNSYLLRAIAFLITGISASQLNADVDILENKIRLRKPLVQPFDGPFNRTNAWLKQFYSESSPTVGHIGCDAYKNDW
jgi:nitrite reductase/ring-hydroxylating ferredoxin subunit